MDDLKEVSEPSDQDELKKRKFEALKKFFSTDIRIKNEMLDSAPSELDDYDESSRIDYMDGLYDKLKLFKTNFTMISEDFDFEPCVNEALESFFKKAQKRFELGRYDEKVGSDMYNKIFASMDPGLIEDVKDNFVGYTLMSDSKLEEMINKSSSINELLHVMHSFITNNDGIMQSMPLVETKKTGSGYDNINLYGEPTEISSRIFTEFPPELDVGETDIISMDGKTLLMIRDRGHALTIDINSSDKDNVDVAYFIPKLCNEKMIRQLEGVSNISQTGARGGFVKSSEEVVGSLFDFIGKVPTDLDMEFDNISFVENNLNLPQFEVDEDRISDEYEIQAEYKTDFVPTEVVEEIVQNDQVARQEETESQSAVETSLLGTDMYKKQRTGLLKNAQDYLRKVKDKIFGKNVEKDGDTRDEQ